MFFGNNSHAQFTTVLNIPDTDPNLGDNETIGSYTQLNLSDGGSIGDHFISGDYDTISKNIELNITGGSIGDYARVLSGNKINLSDGTVGRNFRASGLGTVLNISGGTMKGGLSAYGIDAVNISGGVIEPQPYYFGSGSFIGFGPSSLLYPGLSITSTTLNMTGGVINGNFNANSGSIANIRGGEFNKSIKAYSGSNINFYGGRSESFTAYPGSTTNITGGIFKHFTAERSGRSDLDIIVNISGGSFGSTFRVEDEDIVTLFGNDFRLNGVPHNDSTISLGGNDVFTGILSDGTSFIFSNNTQDRIRGLKLTQTAIAPIDTNPIYIYSSGSNNATNLSPGQTLNLQEGGELGQGYANLGGTLNINGGKVGALAKVYEGTVNISGGKIDSWFFAYDGSTVNISGGMIGESFSAASGSTVNISGGHIGPGFHVAKGATINFQGGDYRLNGNSYGEDTVALEAGDVFSGTLSDGSSFIYKATKYNSNLPLATLNRVPLPKVDLTPREITSPISEGTFGLRPGQTLTVLEGGSLHKNFASVGATLNIQGGFLDENSKVIGGTVNISEGRIGSRFEAFDGSTINITGGRVGSYFQAQSGSKVYASGGIVEGSIIAHANSEVNISDKAQIPEISMEDGATVNVAGGYVSSINADSESTLNVSGGTIGDSLYARRATVNISGGNIGDDFSSYYSSVNITGGSLGDKFKSTYGTVNISDGLVGDGFEANFSSRVNISGGTFGSVFKAKKSSRIAISGGHFGPSFIDAEGNTVGFTGGDFRFNGTQYQGSSITLSEGDTFSGRFADGSVFVFSRESSDYLTDVTLTRTTLPSISNNEFVVDTYLPENVLDLKQGQTLTIKEGGTLRKGFVSLDATINLDGGSLNDFTKVVGTTVGLRDGVVGDYFLASDSKVKVSGGTTGKNFSVVRSDLEVTKGTIGKNFSATKSSIRMSGGSFLNGLDAKDSDIEINGGAVDSSFIISNSEADITGGNFGHFTVYENSSAMISGGNFRNASIGSGSSISISGGEIESEFRVYANAIANVTGGIINKYIVANKDSKINFSGGSISTIFRANAGSEVNISGGDFRLNGETYTDNSINLDANDVFTGTFADGSPFIFSSRNDSSFEDVNLKKTPLPIYDLDPIVMSSNEPNRIVGLNSGQYLTLKEGGKLPNQFKSVGATLVIEGGELGDYATFAESLVKISGGTIGKDFSAYLNSEVSIGGKAHLNSIELFSGSKLAISDKSSVYNIRANGNNQINVSGGEVTGYISLDGGVANISEGLVRADFRIWNESVVNLSGGNVEEVRMSNSTLNISGGRIDNLLRVYQNSRVNLIGTNWFLDGIEIDGLEAGDSFIIDAKKYNQLTGTLANGRLFSFSEYFPNVEFRHGSILSVELVVEDFLRGDYNDDGKLTMADYDLWKRSVGQDASVLANNFHSGIVGQAEYETLMQVAGFELIPEPDACLLILLAISIRIASSARKDFQLAQ